MDRSQYLKLVEDAYRKIADAFEDVDGDDADLEPKGDVLTIRYRDGSRVVVNTQGPVFQIWLAGAGRGWHFSWDEATDRWLDDKGTGEDLLAVVRRITKDTAGIDLAL